MLFAYDVTNKYVTTSTEKGKPPRELWFGIVPIPDYLRPFAAEGYVRWSMSKHNMAPRIEKCALMGITRKFPTVTISVLLAKTRKIVERQGLQWMDGPDKTGSDGVSNENLGVEPSKSESVVRRGAPALEMQELEPEEHPASQERE